MLVAVVGAILLIGAGFACQRALGVARAPVAIALTPSAGTALLAVLAVWGLRLGVTERVAGLALLGMCLAGIILLVRACGLRARGIEPSQGVTSVLLLAAMLVPIVVLGSSTPIQVGLPTYAHDGAHHAETLDALRHGRTLPGLEWYPVGFHAPAAALLSLAPSIDSASGVVDWAASITMLAPLAAYGFAFSVWRNRQIAAASGLMLALTASYPYNPHLYSVWPMATSLLLVLGLWATTLAYLHDPRRGYALLAGLLAGAIVVSHATEVYTAAPVLLGLAVAHRKQLACRRVVLDIAGALTVAIVCALPYLPLVVNWAGSGGAVSVGTDYFVVRQAALLTDGLSEAAFWANSLGTGLVVDLPIRLGLVSVGAWIAFRQRTARLMVVMSVLFVMLIAMFRHVDAQPVQAVFALTLPWGVDDRLIMTLSLLTAPLSGAGLVWLSQSLMRRSHDYGVMYPRTPNPWPARIRLGLTLAISVGVASTVLMAWKLNVQTSSLLSYSADDAAAFSWLEEHAETGAVLMNDGAADAGIWTPYKAGVSIVLSRTKGVRPDGPELLLRGNLALLDSREDVRSAACELHVTYVYRGGAPGPENRQFPSIATLQALTGLEQVFGSGQAAIFRTRLGCAS